MNVEVSAVLPADRETIESIYLNWRDWPHVFPTIHAVRLLERRGATSTLEISHDEGTVVNELTLEPDGTIRLRERKRRYDAEFHTELTDADGATRARVTAAITLKGAARVLRPFLAPYVRRQINHLQLLPLVAAARQL